MAAAVSVLSVLCWRTASADTWTNQYNVITWTNEQGIAWRYTIDNGEACVGSGQHGLHIARAVPYGTVGNITIPSELGGCPVTGIGEAAFYECTNLTGVVIPDTVRKIGDLAFYKSPIKSVKIGSNVLTIGKASFHDCRQLRSVEIPDSVTSLGSGAFALCTSLRFLSIGNGLTNINYSAHNTLYWGTGNFTYCGTSFSTRTFTIQTNPFESLTNLVAISFGTAIQAVNWNAFDGIKNLKYVYFPGALPLRSKTMPGVANRVCYITHEAYPDGLPNPTWSDVPLQYYDGNFPSEDVLYDLAFAGPQAGADGLVAYYKFNGDATDSSGYGNDGATQGVALTQDRHGNANSAYYFDGASHIEVPNSSSLSGVGKNVTCSVWIKPEAWDSIADEWMVLLCKGESIPSNIGFSIWKKEGLELNAYNPHLALPTLPELDKWQMLTYTSDGTTVKYYVNGVCIASTNWTITAKSNTSPLLIGKDPPGDLEYFKGAMDEVRIYNRALSDAEVYELYAFGEDAGTVVQIHSPGADGIPKSRVLQGDPVCLSYRFQDMWGIGTVVPQCLNRVTLVKDPSGDVVGATDDIANPVDARQVVSRTGLELPIFQNLECGTYRATLELNADGALGETDYSNNTNTVAFTVVPSVEVTFSSEGNTVATRRYGAGDPYGTFTDSPIREGFRFVGWFTDEEGGDAVTASSIVPDLPITLYAHWDVAIKETLPVGGNLPSGETKWLCGNLYKVTSDLVVPSGATLTIEPGAIVKFAAGKSLTVNNGGTLKAIGTRALPIVFTSIKDDANGGDTNDDGDVTSAAGGDWYGISVYGKADFAYATMMYAGPSNERGIIETRNSGALTMDSCKVAHSKYDGIWNWGGTIRVTNSIIADTGWASAPYQGSKNEYINCVFYQNDVGLCYWGHWSGKPIYKNCIFAECLKGWCETASGKYGDPPAAVTIGNCLFFNSPESGMQSCGRVGIQGNAYGNPIFINPERGDFRVAANSPCVDAGDGKVAPTKDYYGSPRMNVDVVRPTGTAAANGAVPDIGIYEVPGDGNIPAADLTVTTVTAPASLTVGENVEVSWTVQNIGEEPTAGMWRDEIEIVAANGQAFSMGTITSQAEIKPGATANFKRTLTVPSAPEGAVQVRVTANKYQDLFEAMKSDNNVGSAAATLAVPMLAVPADGTATTVTLGADSDYGFKVATSATLPSQGGVLVIRSEGELDAWLGNGSIAGKDNAIRTAVKIADDTWLLQVPPESEPRVTVRNDGEGAVAAQLSLEVGAFLLLDTGKNTAANSGVVTVPFAGNGFDESVTCWLEKDGVRIDAADVSVESGVSACATFDVTGCAAGDWTLHVKKGTDEASASLLTLTESRIGPKWYGEVDVPDAIRSGRAYVGTFRYGNAGDTVTNAPYVRLEAKGSTLIRFSEADAWSKSIELMASSDTYPASVLKAGDSSTVMFFYKTTGTQAEIEYAYTFASTTNVPWAELETEMRPAWATDELWGFAFATLRANFGETWNDYLARMRADCDHLLKIGSPVKRMDRLMQLEVNDALGNDTALARLVSATDLARSGRGLGIVFARSYSSSLRGRFTKGILGYGWTDNFSSYAELQDAQTLVFHLPSGGSYSFTKVTGSWQPEDARDKTVLTETKTTYVLTYASGTVQTFAKSNMKTASIRDNQGNEQTFTYSGSQLQKVQHSDGQFLTFTYSGGKLTKATDDQGRTVTYAYTGDLLTSVTAFNGLVTRYEYVSDSGKPTNRSLSKITYPDGSTKEFTYDAKGRVASSSVNGGKMKTQIVRDDFGCYSIVAPNGGVTEVTVGANGETLKTVNARGETVKQSYTADSLLEATIAPSGKRSKITYNKDGSPIASMSASGASTALSYEPEFNNLASVTDAKGHALSYSYDELGRSTAVSYADGSSSTLEYNDKGDVVRSTNRRGETIEYEYDAEGNLVKKTWPNGRIFTLAYDTKGNVTNASDSVTGAVTMEYDAIERLTKIVYPKIRGFTYKYDAYGRTIERASLDGKKQCYSYDSFGRLAMVTDGTNPYLTNAYDPATGWLVTQTYGNGTVVSNAYDVLGRTVGIYHLKGGNRLAFFEYEYDEDGKCISQTTAEGVEAYAYDADGQLIGVAYPDGTSETFAYDAVGNRTSYTVNELNQYLSGNGATFTYDLDGNMTSRKDADGTTTYAYDTLNRLVAVTNEAKNIRWSCEYDVFGNRVSVTDSGTTTERLFVQGSLPSVAAEYQGDTLAKSHVLVGAVRLATHNSPTPNSPTLYYHSDLLGSARLLTDGSGATKGTSSYRAFGETRVYTGERTDAGYVGTLGVETDSNGLLFMRNRYYDAGMGRFVQMDPIGVSAGDINPYVYCHNGVLGHVDPNGLTALDILTDAVVDTYGVGSTEDVSKTMGLDSIASYANGALENDFAHVEDIYNIGKHGTAEVVDLSHGDLAAANQDGKDLTITLTRPIIQLSMLGGGWIAKGISGLVLPHGGDAKWEKILQDASTSNDPNEITGPLGIGEKRYVQQGEWMNYTIYFENTTNATAAAQEIFVDLPMDENLDWSTLELGEIAFGEHIDTTLVEKKLAGKSKLTSSYAMPGTNTSVKTEVKMKDGVLSWYIRDWDPTTADNFPASATGGFLPPNDPETHCGEGHLSFRVRVKDDAPNGTVINASATIVFDSNSPIETDPSWWNTVSPIDEFLQAGEYFKAMLAELGYDVPTDGKTPYTVKALGLPAGLQLKYNAAETKKVKQGKTTKTVVVKPAKVEWWIEGVPTAAVDFFTNPPYLVITANGVTTTEPLPIEVLAQEVMALEDLALGQALNEQYYLPGVTNGWTVSGLPTGLKYTAKLLTTSKKVGKKTVVTTNALPYSVYGKTTKAGLFTITAKRKTGAFYETLKYRVLVRPAPVDTELFGEELANITTMAYVPFEWDLTNDVAAVGGKVAKVAGLPAGLAFASATTYKDKKKTQVKQYGQTIVGTPTKPGTYVVTFTKNVTTGTGKKKKTVAKTAQILWTVVENDAELELAFNIAGGVIEGGSVGLKYGDLMSFTATDGATVTASGMPAGITLANLGGGSYAFTGFTTKAGTYLVTVKATLNGKTVTQRMALEVDALPAWAKGTFNGYVAGEDGATNGLAAVTVSSVGKISGKFYEGGTNWTFTAASYTGYDDAAPAYSVPVVAKYSYKAKEKVKVNGKWTTKTVAKYVTRDFTLKVGQDALGGMATLEEVDGSTVHAWQNLWGQADYKALGTRLFSTKSGKKTLAYRTFTIKGTDDVGAEMGLTDAMSLSLKVTTAGAVTATMSFDTGTKSKGKAVIYKPTCSTVVIPLSAADNEEFEGEAILFFAPSSANGFPGFAGAAPF